MSKPLASQILAKASNCFYVQLDSQLNIKTANHYFARFFSNPSQLTGTPFLSLFPIALQSQLQKAIVTVDADSIEAAALQTQLKLDGNKTEITWNIGTLTGDENSPAGYELLGVFSPFQSNEGLEQSENSTRKKALKLKAILVKLNKILDSLPDLVCVLDEEGIFLRVSAASKTLLGYEPKELIGKNFIEFVEKQDIEKSLEISKAIILGFNTSNFENRFVKKDGSLASIIWSSKWDEDDKRFYSIGRDAAEKKAAEEALKASEEKYRIIFYNHPLPMWIYDTDTYNFIEVNEATVDHLGYTREEFLNMKITDVLPAEESRKFEDLYKQSEYYKKAHRGLWAHRKKNGEVIVVEITSNALSYKDRNAKLVISIDRTEKIKAEQELLKSNERYSFLSAATFDAIWDWDLATGEVQWNEGIRKMFVIPSDQKVGDKNWWFDNLHEDDRERVVTKLNKHINESIPNWEDEYRFKSSEDNYIYVYDRAYLLFDENKKAVRMIGAMQNLTERKAHENMLQKLNNSLEKRAKELAESNAELERFAYVASHDLQEPLRMVTSFLQLLEKRYKGKLDQKAHEYINYAVDGAERMKRLILDLLEYSKVNSSKVEKEDVDLNEIVNDLRFTYKNILSENKGTINNEKLPIVKANKTQLMQLFQNLVGNAFKYQSDEPPIITISCIEDNKMYEFSVTDNGIGIDPRFFNKIFIIFQRLHNREQYSGTGIGLAICKKIIDKHGGKIWVTSFPGKGSTFYFTLPKSK